MSKPRQAKIDLIIVGAQKSATTSLKHYLGEHPSVLAHPQRELAFFLDKKEYDKGEVHMLKKYFTQGKKNGLNMKMVAKSATLYTSEESLKRVQEYNPDCKIVITLRNPVERVYSSFLMEIPNIGIDFKRMKEVAANSEDWRYKAFIESGIYAHHIQNIYKYFPKEQVMILLYEDIKNNGVEVCRKIYKWLGIDNSFTPEVNRQYNLTTRKKSHLYSKVLHKMLAPHSVIRRVFNTIVPEHYNHKLGNALRDLNKKDALYEEMDSDTRNFLKEFYRPYNQELEVLIGRDLSDWTR